jgi:2,3-bisphosphoglycerate-dependent phosphoglycerate mutase
MLLGLTTLFFTVSLAFHSPFTATRDSKRNSIAATSPTLLNLKDLKSGYDTDVGYSRFLYSTKRKRRHKKRDDRLQRLIEEDEDGYKGMRIRDYPLWKRVLIKPLKLGYKVMRRITNGKVEIGTLILVRHGESEWNANKTFTGWADPDLSEQGIRETEHAARLLLAGGYDIDVVFTSRLKRAIRSAWIILGEMNQLYIPVFKSWRLNERMYGALTGLCKKETAEQLGAELVQSWRGSLRSCPPPVSIGDSQWPGRDRRYSDLSMEQIPLTESLLDCMERTIPAWEHKIKWELRKGRTVLVVAHANTLRGLVKLIDNIGDA